MLAIEWPVAPEEVVLSDKDRNLGRFSEFASPFEYGGDHCDGNCDANEKYAPTVLSFKSASC